MNLIDKDILVAEIDNMLNTKEHTSHSDEMTFNSGRWKALKKVKDIINALEVKEVDLDKETTHYLLYEHRSPLNEIMHEADLKSEMQYHKDIENAFKAGVGLGMQVSNKVQKEENLEKSISDWLSEGLPNDEELIDYIKETAEHFFELGLSVSDKAQKL